MDTFRDFIRALGGPTAVSRELGTKFHRVVKWSERNSIPAEHWHDLLTLAATRGVDVSADDLVRMARTEESAA